MKALVVYDPKSKFTLEALKAVEYKLAELENLELVYVADRLRLIGTAFGRMAFDTRGRFLRNFPLFTLAAREHRFDG